MVLGVLAACLVGAILVCIKVFSNQGAAMKQELSKLKKEKATYEAAISDLEREIDVRTQSVNQLRQDVEAIDPTALQAPEPGLLTGEDKTPTVAVRKKASSVIDILLREKMINQQQLNKVLEYQSSTGSDMSAEDIMLMFGFVSDQQIKKATRMRG